MSAFSELRLFSLALLAAISITSDAAAQNANEQKPSTSTQNMEKDKSSSSSERDKADVMPPFSFESWTFYFDRVDRDSSAVYFDKGSATLSDLEKNRLRDWVSVLKEDDRNLSSAVVASWSDKPYPTKASETLTKADRELADRRNANVRDVLMGAGLRSVEIFSMAEKPNWFQKTFGTDSAQIKGEAENKRWDEKNEDRIASILRRRGGPSKSIVIFRPQADASSLTGGR